MTQQSLITKMIVDRVRDIRKRRGWSAQAFANELKRVGLDWDRSVVANLEAGRRNWISVEELLAIASVLDVAPVHLIVPTDDNDAAYPVTSEQTEPRDTVRNWIRGHLPLSGTDIRLFYSEVPAAEWPLVRPPNQGTYEDHVEMIDKQREALDKQREALDRWHAAHPEKKAQ